MATKTTKKDFKLGEWFKKNWLYVLIVLIIIVLIWYFLKQQNKGGALAGQTPDEGGFSIGGSGFGGSSFDKHKMLSLGSSGAEVLELQKMINNAYTLYGMPEKKITADGSFGSQTQAALLETMGQSSTTLAQAEAKFNQVFG